MEACFAMKLKNVYLWLFISEFWLESELWDLVYILQFWVLRIILHVSNLNFISTTGNLYLTILTFLLSIVSLYLASIYRSVCPSVCLSIISIYAMVETSFYIILNIQVESFIHFILHILLEITSSNISIKVVNLIYAKPNKNKTKQIHPQTKPAFPFCSK